MLRRYTKPNEEGTPALSYTNPERQIRKEHSTILPGPSHTSDDLIDMFDIHLSPSVFSQPKAVYSSSRLHF